MAAYNHVGDSFLHVSEALHCNGIGTANLLECYRDYERFIYMSTSETYGNQTTVPFQESMTPFPISPYAVGKYTGELYARMMQHVHGLPIVVLKPFNTFGPFQSPRAVIGEMIIKCLKGQMILATEGMQTREFNYVDNVVDGLMSAGQSDEGVGEVINIASGEEISIKDLILKIHNRFHLQEETFTIKITSKTSYFFGDPHLELRYRLWRAGRLRPRRRPRRPLSSRRRLMCTGRATRSRCGRCRGIRGSRRRRRTW